jgi:hypothetical protein
MRGLYWVVVPALVLVVGCATTAPGPDRTPDMADLSLGQNVRILEGPVVVMPVVYRTLTYIVEDVNKRKREVDVLAATARPVIARLLEAKGGEVVAFPELDNRIAEVMPDYWSEESRAPDKLRLLAEKTGAKKILFFDVEASYSYKRHTVLDYLSYQAAAPDIVGVAGYMEVYDHKGEPIQAFGAVAEIPGGTSIEALSRSVFCIGANWFFHGYVPPEPSVMKGMMMPGQMVPSPQISANRALYAEAKATEVLIERMLSACLGTRDFGDLEDQPLRIDQSLVKRSWYSIDVSEEPSEPILAPRGSKIGVLLAMGGPTGKVTNLTPHGTMKYSAFSKGKVKEMERKAEKASADYKLQVLQELTRIGQAKGYTVAHLQGENMWRSGMLQDFSSAMMMKRARDQACDILILVKTKSIADSRMTKFEASVKILDARSGKFRKDFFVSEPKKIAVTIMNSAIIPPKDRISY